jgi:CBS domain-containing protein
MQAKEVMTSKVVTCSLTDPISQILSKMIQNNIHQLPVLQGKELRGIVTIRSIITKEIDPTKTYAKTVMVPSPSLNPEEDIQKAIELIVGSNLRAIPVFDTQLRGIISETDLMKLIDMRGSAQAIMREAITVDENDDIGKVKKLMIQKNISRVPVTTKGKCIGVVDTLDLVKRLQPGHEKFSEPTVVPGGQKHHGSKEKQNIDKVSVKNVMREPKIVNKDEPLKNIALLLKENDSVLIDNTNLGIITPKDVLRLVIKPKEFELVQIVGAEDIDAFILNKIYQAAEEIVKPLSKSMRLQPMRIHVKKHQKHGARKSYEIRIELPTSLGNFHSTKTHSPKGKKYSDLATLAQEALKDLEKEIRRKHDQIKDHDKAKWSKRMRR